MSPASQGTLEVERYIGSCLISSSAACNSGSHKSKKVSDNGGSRTASRTSGVVADAAAAAAAAATCQDHHFSIYHPSNSIVSLCECGSFKFAAGRYGSSAVGGNWAGLPLISMAPPNSRRNRKANRNTKTNYPNQQAIVNRSGEHGSRTPLSRLAIHTQGAPLILSGRYNGRKSTSNKEASVRQPREDTAARRNIGATSSNNSTPSSDCLSIASDESSGHSENSLPRIIKPRKRRKKDRKAPPQENKIDEVENGDTQSPSIVTLRPYVPLCYDIYDSGRRNESRWSLAKEDVERKVKVWEIENKHTCRLPYVIEVQADDDRVSHASDDESLEPNLQHNFDEVEDDEEGLLLETNTSFPYHFPTTHCHCRYCDPSGLIWDIDQHYYSPLLTPPPLTSANVPLYFSPSTAAILNLDFLNKDVKHSPSHTLFMESNSHTGLLHRSWSEPLYSTLSSNDHSNERSESDFGCSTISHKYPPQCSEILTESASTKGTTIPSAMNMFTSQSLEVSTEIVTSPNGHRDIEIKFYSSSPPAEAAVISVDDCDSANASPNPEKGSDTAVDCSNNSYAKGSKLSQLWKVPAQCSASVSDMCSVDLSEEDQSAKKLGDEVRHLHLNGEEHETSTESVK